MSSIENEQQPAKRISMRTITPETACCPPIFWHFIVTCVIALMLPGAAFAQVSEALLRARMDIWLRNAPLCNGQPTKLYEEGGPGCSDGDMNLFSGLLCIAGVKDLNGKLIGCNSVAAAQEPSGRWHRSPRRMLDPTIADGEKSANIASFSPDMALGTQMYLLTTHDVVRGTAWIKWLDEHRPCWAGNEPECNLGIGSAILKRNVRGLPRFCTDEPGPPQPDETDADKTLRSMRIDPRCSMRPGDLATLAKTREAIKVYNFSGDDVTACASLPSGTWDDAKTRFDKLEKLLNLTNLDNLMKIVDGGLPYTLRLMCPEASTWVRLGAEFNKPGYSMHLVATQLLLLRKLGPDDNLLQESATRLVAKEPENPFFLFLKKGKSNEVLEKIIQYCPKSDADAISSKKSEWMWERSFGVDWQGKSSMWDCLFIGQLWLAGT